MRRFRKGEDLLESLTKVAVEEGVEAGSFTGLGTVQHANVGFFKDAGEYSTVSLDGPLEIVACVGNITLKNHQPFVHAHITLADERGNAFGGHVMPGSRIDATFELTIHAYKGMKLVRQLDQDTKLFLINA